MTLEEVGKLFDTILDYYPSFSADLSKLQSWRQILTDTPLDQALANLTRYAENPENKYPPHPGALMTKTTDVDRYFEGMRAAGKTVTNGLKKMREGIAPPTAEQRRKVRELLG